MQLNLKFKRTHPKAQAPSYGHEGDTCFDLRAVIDGDPVVIPPGGQAKFDTGLAFMFDKGWAMDVYSRSGMGFSKQVRLSNSIGVIDNPYRNSVKVALHNDSSEPFIVSHGDRIAQGRLVEVHEVTFQEVDEVDETNRGTAGLGSTGMQ